VAAVIDWFRPKGRHAITEAAPGKVVALSPSSRQVVRDQLLDTTRRRQDLRGRPLHEPRHLMIGTEPTTNLHQPIGRPHIVAVRPGRHVAVRQSISQQRISRSELRRQLGAKTAHIGLNLSARAIRHQADNLPIKTSAAQVPRPIQRMKPGLNQLRGIPDVMKPSCRHQLVGQSELLRDPPRAPSHGPDMARTPRQGGGKQ
jgi:hypothetical protein